MNPLVVCIIACLSVVAVWPVLWHYVTGWWRTEQTKLRQQISDALGEE